MTVIGDEQLKSDPNLRVNKLNDNKQENERVLGPREVETNS